MGIGDFGTSPIFVRLSDKSLLASALLIGVPKGILQWRIERLCADPIRWGDADRSRFMGTRPNLARGKIRQERVSVG
jgi:hypothetical protein